MFVFLC